MKRFAAFALISVLAMGLSIASPGKRPVVFRSFVNLLHLDAIRSHLKVELPREGLETKVLSFKVDPAECFIYPAKEGYDYLKVADLKPATKPGEPQLPMKTFVVELDKNAEVYGVEVVDGLVREIDGDLKIIPTSQPTTWEQGAKEGGHIPDEKVYSMNNLFPGKLVTFETGKDNRLQYVFVRLFPVQYNPSKKKAVMLTEATIKLYYSSAESSEEQGVMEQGLGSSCVIICPNSLSAIAESLAIFHNGIGIPSTVETTEDISDAYDPDPDQHPPYSGYSDRKLRGWRNIKGYNYDLAREIVKYLRASPGLEYVTILGDGELVPPSYYYSEKGGWYSDWIPTDFFYASPYYDLIPELKVGRLPVSDYEEAEDMVSKIGNWYNYSDLNGWDWFRNVYLVGGRGHDTPEYHGERGTIMPTNWGYFDGMVVNKCFSSDEMECKECMEPAIADMGGTDNVEAGIIFHMDHGSGQSITLEDGDDLYAANLLAYSPPLHPTMPIFISVSCYNGAFDLDLMERSYTISFGEAVLKSPAAGIAYFGGSRTNQGAGDFSYYIDGNIPWDEVKESYNVELLHYVLESYHGGADTLGEMADYSLREFVTANIMEGENLASLFRFVLLGDPALKIPAQIPATENGIAICEAVNPAGYDGSDIPVYVSAPVTIGATSPSQISVNWKLIDANADEPTTLDYYDLNPINTTCYYESSIATQTLYQVRTATESVFSDPDNGIYVYAKENWLFYKIEGGGEGVMHVSDIAMGLVTKGSLTNATATVTIVGADGNPVEGATVYGKWSGLTSDSDSGITDGSGLATLSSDKVRKSESGSIFAFEVTDVNLSGWIYNSSANTETTDSVTVP